MPGQGDFDAKRSRAKRNANDTRLDPAGWPVLTPGQEFHLFRRLNFHRYHILARLPDNPSLIPSLQSLAAIQANCTADLKDMRHLNETLARCNLGLVGSAINRYVGHDRDELASLGQVTLVQCIQSFNPFRGIRFCTYASQSIHKNIAGHLRSNRQQLPTVDLVEHVSDERTDDDEPTTTEEISEWLMDGLTDMQQKVIRYRMGFSGQPKTLEEIGILLGRTKQAIHDAEKRAIARMKRMVSAD